MVAQQKDPYCIFVDIPGGVWCFTCMRLRISEEILGPFNFVYRRMMLFRATCLYLNGAHL